MRQNYLVTINGSTAFSDGDFSDLANYNITGFAYAVNPSGTVNVSVQSTPEPSTWVLLTSAVALAALRMREKRPAR